MSAHDPRDFVPFTGFVPEEGVVIRRPEAEGPGYWVGAPGAFYDVQDRAMYLVWRVRRPRGVEPDRGAEIVIARSRDGIEFHDLWRGAKDQLRSTSIERCALARSATGMWRLYVSYVDPADGRWRIDLVEAPTVEALDLTTARRVFTAADIDAEGVKDPFIFRVAGRWHMIASYATADAHASAAELHGTQDAYNTGLIRSRSGLATSGDGVSWTWVGGILGPPAAGWDQYCARIGCVWREDGMWLALYDGSADVAENYEERAGLAYSYDLRSFERVSMERPLMTPAHGLGAVRYFDVVSFNTQQFFYYELARADGSHDLRVVRRPFP